MIFLKKKNNLANTSPYEKTQCLLQQHRRTYGCQWWAGQVGGGRSAPRESLPLRLAASRAPGASPASGPQGDQARRLRCLCLAGRGRGRGRPSAGRGHGPWGEARMAQGPGQHSPNLTAPGGDSPPGCRQGFSGLRSGGFCCGKTCRPEARSLLRPARGTQDPQSQAPPGEEDPQQPAAPGPSPLHPLHQVGHELVRDAGAGLLGQAKGVLQLLQRPRAPAAELVLLLKLRGRPRLLTGGRGGASRPARPVARSRRRRCPTVPPSAEDGLPGRVGPPSLPWPLRPPPPTTSLLPTPVAEARSLDVREWPGQPRQPGHWD